ncbi:hypothetical protein ANRL1_04700 [Anaerolineae bacterium]|nr:hypothetical protein ANRL1_04700 [Anaerolineae bacterium]
MTRFSLWLARIAVGIVFAVNVWCALVFIFDPGSYVGGFELNGLPGRIIIQGFGILFLMWNATYPPVIFDPRTQRTLFVIILIQQAIGVIGETWLWLSLPSGHSALAATALRFIVFDGIGLIAMGFAFVMLRHTGVAR